MQKTNVQEKAEYLIGDVARMVGPMRLERWSAMKSARQGS